jgi:hypothetical protein
VIKRCSQGLKALICGLSYGTAEAVPFLQRLFSKKQWKNVFKGLSPPRRAKACR